MQINYVSPEEAVMAIKSNDRVHIHSCAAAPQKLINAMCERGRRGELHNVTIQHLHTEGPAPYADPEFEGVFNMESFFVGANVRQSTQLGYADYIPVFLQETQRLIRDGYCVPNVVLLQCTEPDKHGYVSLGTSIEATLAAIENADVVIASVNPNVPRSFGDTMIRAERITIFTKDDTPLMEAKMAVPNDIEIAIGKNVAELVEDGATLQMGIGSVPNAVLAQLGNHKNLGVHTEVFADGILPLVEKGVVNGSLKNINRGKMVATFIMGSRKVYDFIDDNPGVLMKDVGYTNDVNVISKLDKMTSINSALQIDLTGQICADSIGTKFYSGVGGQLDFITGASMSKGGKAIIAMSSVTPKGVSKFASIPYPGSGVVTTRAQVHWVVTEYGKVDLYGLPMQKRAKALIEIAHPDHREALDREAFERFGSHYHFVCGK